MLVSYAQNLEDVMLWRALGPHGPGFYIDVGANHPTEDSVTRGFYELGWRGINIEPLPDHVRELQRDRPRDINLGIALGRENGALELAVPPVRGWATGSAEVVDALSRAGHALHRVTVPMQTLAAVWDAHAPADVHFLKIDVEGLEHEVLAGADLARHRPWVVVVEATRPNSTEPSHQAWEPLLLDAGYEFAHFDGLNRFYAAAERPALRERLSVPVNIHDATGFRLRPGHPFCSDAPVRGEQVELLRLLDTAERALVGALDRRGDWRRAAEAVLDELARRRAD